VAELGPHIVEKGAPGWQLSWAISTHVTEHALQHTPTGSLAPNTVAALKPSAHGPAHWAQQPRSCSADSPGVRAAVYDSTPRSDTTKLPLDRWGTRRR
jgi:hypothetical protein